MHLGKIVFVHWNNDVARSCPVGGRNRECDDCWLHGNQTQQEALRSWFDYQHHLETRRERLLVKHCANTTEVALDLKSRNSLELMRAIFVRNTGGAYEELDLQESRTKNIVRSSSDKKIDWPHDYCEREEF